METEHYVDVRDCARLHVAALVGPDIKSERVFGYAYKFNWTDVIKRFQELRPANRQIPDPPENDWSDLTEVKPSKRGEEILQFYFGKSWTSLDQSLEEGIEGWE